MSPRPATPITWSVTGHRSTAPDRTGQARQAAAPRQGLFAIAVASPAACAAETVAGHGPVGVSAPVLVPAARRLPPPTENAPPGPWRAGSQSHRRARPAPRG